MTLCNSLSASGVPSCTFGMFHSKAYVMFKSSISPDGPSEMMLRTWLPSSCSKSTCMYLQQISFIELGGCKCFIVLQMSTLRISSTHPTRPVASDDFLGLILGTRSLLEYDVPSYHPIFLFEYLATLNHWDKFLGKTYLALQASPDLCLVEHWCCAGGVDAGGVCNV